METRCAEGAVCGIADGYGACSDGPGTDERRATKLLGAFSSTVLNFEQFVSEKKALAPDWPLCTSDADCPNAPCFFQPGCGAMAHGICCGTTWPVCDYARYDAVTEGLDVYCGCDGETYRGTPTQPYVHPGPCP